jgi:hypothetical protein
MFKARPQSCGGSRAAPILLQFLKVRDELIGEGHETLELHGHATQLLVVGQQYQ